MIRLATRRRENRGQKGRFPNCDYSTSLMGTGEKLGNLLSGSLNCHGLHVQVVRKRDDRKNQNGNAYQSSRALQPTEMQLDPAGSVPPSAREEQENGG